MSDKFIAKTGEWYDAKIQKPNDDQTILVSWKEEIGRWASPIRAYYNSWDDRYFAVDCQTCTPIDIDIWTFIPDPSNSNVIPLKIAQRIQSDTKDGMEFLR